MGAGRKVVQNAIFHGKRRDNKILKVKILLSRKGGGTQGRGKHTINQKNPRAHKNKIGKTPPKPPPPKKKRGILRTWFFLQKERIFSRCP